MAFKKKISDGDGGLQRLIAERDFVTLLPMLSVHEYAIEMHRALDEDTKLIINERGQFQLDDVNRILAIYPSRLSWSGTVEVLVGQVADRAVDEFNDWQNEKYQGVVDNWQGKKGTIKEYEAKAFSDNKELFLEKREFVRDMKAKAAIAKNGAATWKTFIHSVQSLSKNINAEMDMIKRRMEA